MSRISSYKSIFLPKNTLKCHTKHIQDVLRAGSAAAYSSSADEELLHRSRMPTDHFQASLPRLPVPKLEQTCERYLNAQQPLLTSEQWQSTKKIVDTFRDGEGKELHEELVATNKRNKHTSYISAMWSDMYLKDRRAVALNHNPFMAFKDDDKPGYNDQLVRSTNFVVSVMRFLKTYRANILEPEVYHLNPAKSDNDSFRNFVRWLPQSVSWYGAYWYKAFPLDMSQFPRLFNTSRIPRATKDELYSDFNARHLAVFHKGHVYTVDVLNEDGSIVGAEEIMASLRAILQDSRPPAEFPVGVMTTQDRDTWTQVHEQLVNSGNAEALQKIDGALFALVLDSEKAEDPSRLSRMFLHSDGTNRWYDKCFSLIVAGDGKACVNFEHSWGDGVAVLRLFNEIYKDTTEQPRVHPDTKPADASVVESRLNKIDFQLTDDVKAGIECARKQFAAKTAGLDLSFIKYDKMGKEFIKKQKFSPDAFMQFGIQLAYYRQYGETVASYESCSTSAFKHGRTETIRPTTMATKRACEMFEKSGTRPSVTELQACMNECSKMHGQLTKEAAMGQGFDRHLFALRYIAEGRGRSLDIFTEPNYKHINHVILSTSTLSSPGILIGGFGPVVPDGFGIGYGIYDDALGYIVTAYPPNRDVHGFLDCMKTSVDDMKSVLEGNDIK